MQKTLYILDGTYYVFRAFYAVRGMTNASGMPTNGLFAFTSMLLNLIRDHQPDHLAVAFDPPGPTFRNDMYAEYKANRSETPEDLIPQFPYFRRIVESLRIPVVEVPGYEADDAIATLCRHAGRDGLRVIVLSGDKDLSQLVDEHTTLYDSMRDKTVDLAAVLERFQVGPERVPDVLGLAGDTSDNIPGVPGIGEKTAGQLIAEFGDLESLLANLDRVSGNKKRENLTQFADQARLSKTLATVCDTVPITFDLEAFAMCPPDFDAFDALCAELDFNRFRSQLRELFPESSRETALSTASAFDYQTIDTREGLDATIAALRAAGRFAVDLETTSVDPLDAEIVGVALAWQAGRAVYLPVAHRADLFTPQLPRELVLSALRPLLEDPTIAKVGQHAKYEMAVFARYGITLAGVSMDTMLAAYLLDPNKRRYGLDALAAEFLGHRTIGYEDVAGSGKDQKSFADVGIPEATQYAAEDADVTLRLGDRFEGEMKDGPLLPLLRDIEIPLTHVLARMETAGIRVDLAFLGALSEEFKGRIEQAEAEVYSAAGRSFTINSPKQLATVLFEDLRLPVQRKTKTGPSTDQEVLDALGAMHPLPGLITRYRELTKLLSTYVDALPRMVRADTGRVHTDFNQAVAATGRLSSSNPNLQNIPIRTVEGRRIRRAFIPADGWLLLGGDYSQIELRVLAHLSGESSWIEAFQAGQDIHRRTASEVFGIPMDQVTSSQRSAAKTINFGIIYGMGAQRLAAELGIPREEARAYIDRYFERVSGVRRFFDDRIEQARRTGYAETITGRRRPIPELMGGQARNVALGERLAQNTPIQGSAADLIKVAMVRLDAALQKQGFRARMLLQVHDELLLEVPPDELTAVTELVRTTMENVWQLSVPLTVELAHGANWAELKG
jgi:DNA polymerase-1